MIDALLSLGGGIWGYVALAVAAIAGVAGFWFKAKSAGKAQERAKQTEKIHEKVTKADEVRRDVRTDPDKRKRVRRFDRNR